MTLNIMLSIVLGTSLAITAYLAYRNYRRSRLNEAMAHQLDEILQDTLAALKRGDHVQHHSAPEVQDQISATALSDGSDVLAPHMISTLLTVLISKQGTLRLNANDFQSLDPSAYISVYVDHNSKDLILSLDHTLAEDYESTIMGNFGNPDDNTFH